MTRPLEDAERAVLVAMLKRGTDLDAAVEASDRERWLAQVPSTTAGPHCGCGMCPSIELLVADEPAAAEPDQRIVLTGSTIGAMVLVFIDDDQLSYLEMAPIDDGVISRFPPVEALSFDPA